MLQDIQNDTYAAQQETAQTQQAVADLDAEMQAQKTSQMQEQQDFHRLRRLVDTYGQSAHLAQRLHAVRTRLERKRKRHGAPKVTAWEAEVQALAETALRLDENLHGFERPT